jgi:transcriptional regulator GlxA family with amidase domain
MSLKYSTFDRHEPRKIVIVAYESAKLMDICGPLQAFSDARFEDGRPAYKVILASEAGGAIASDTGVKLETTRLDETVLSSIDTLLIAGFDPTLPLISTASLQALLVQYLNRPRRLGSICTGALILAKLGVLDGREATTHWLPAASLSANTPP